MTKQEFCDAFSEKLGMQLEFDEDNNCELSINDNYTVDLWFDEDRNALLMTGVVAEETPEEGLDAFTIIDLLNLSLASAFDGTPAIGRESESGALLAYSLVSLDNTSIDELPQKFGNFVKFVVDMTDHFAQEAE